jgi:hypothetical protein
MGEAGASLGFSTSQHMLLGLVTAILIASLHCLVFAIFTGSGKDTRELVQELRLDENFIRRTKAFKRTVFPPALYCLLYLLILTTLGGALSAKGSPWLGWAHRLFAWFTFYYNVKTFRNEVRAVRENSGILVEVNAVAVRVRLSETPSQSSAAKELREAHLPEPVEEVSWGAHVYALGKFLCFLGFNTWLPYVYFRYIMGIIETPFWPFLVCCLLFLSGGYYLRGSYRNFRPANLARSPSPPRPLA